MKKLKDFIRIVIYYESNFRSLIFFFNSTAQPLNSAADTPKDTIQCDVDKQIIEEVFPAYSIIIKTSFLLRNGIVQGGS